MHIRRDQHNVRFLCRDIFCEIACCPRKSHSYVKSCDFPWPSTNLVLFLTIFELSAVGIDILPSFRPVYVTVRDLQSSFIFILTSIGVEKILKLLN